MPAAEVGLFKSLSKVLIWAKALEQHYQYHKIVFIQGRGLYEVPKRPTVVIFYNRKI